MRLQKKKRVRSAKKKHNPNAGESFLKLKLPNWWSASVHFKVNSDDEVRSIGKAGKSKKKKVIVSGMLLSTLPLYGSE